MALSLAHRTIVAQDELFATTVDEIVRMQEHWKQFVLPLSAKVVGDYLERELFRLVYESDAAESPHTIEQIPQSKRLLGALYVKPIPVNHPIKVFNKTGGMITNPSLPRDARMNVAMCLANAVLPNTPNLAVLTHNVILQPILTSFGFIGYGEAAMRKAHPIIYEAFMADDNYEPLAVGPNPDIFFTNINEQVVA